MRTLAAVALVLALCAGCGSHARSPTAVVRAWIAALDAGDDNAAADLFAPGAEVVQGGSVLRLRTHADAVTWNRGLPCSGKIVALTAEGETVTATFLLGNRATPCDAPGGHATAVFRIRDGRIVLWHQVPETGTPPAPTV